MNTLTYNGTTVTLPEDILWTDEFSWRSVQVTQVYSAAGALLIDSGVKLSGRPMTLSGGEGYAWTTRAVAAQLHAWSLLPGAVMSLVYFGVTRQVIFDQTNGGIVATPIVDYDEYASDDPYFVVLNFLIVG
jgi:hypothetical protein